MVGWRKEIKTQYKDNMEGGLLTCDKVLLVNRNEEESKAMLIGILSYFSEEDSKIIGPGRKPDMTQ